MSDDATTDGDGEPIPVIDEQASTDRASDRVRADEDRAQAGIDRRQATTDRAGTADLAVEVRALAGAILALDQSYKEEQATQAERISLIEEARRSDRWAIRLLVLALAGVVVIGWLLLAALDELHNIAEGNAANGDAIIDCTIPIDALDAEQAAALTDEEREGNRCFELNQARSGAMVAAIVTCTRLPDDLPVEQVYGCVTAQLGLAPTTGAP